MSISDPANLGRWGEEWASLFLNACGYRVVATRYRRPGGEIDLIMRGGDRLVFVEVKTRGQGHLGYPEETIQPRQLSRMRRLARIYLQEHPERRARAYRFDVIVVEFGGEGSETRLRHYPGVG